MEIISTDDQLYRYIAERHGQEMGHRRYLDGGDKDARQAASAAKRALGRDSIRVLEFASGYGRVTRHLRAAMPLAEIAASDIHPQACEFIEENFGIHTYVSSTDPSDLAVGGGYDFVFVLSLFSHLPDRTFSAWLSALYETLAPSGVLLFTTHGDRSRRRFSGIDLSAEENGDGWVYRRRSDQPDLDIEDYGTMIVTPQYVVRAIEPAGGAELLSFNAGRWFGHQDEWMIRRPD